MKGGYSSCRLMLLLIFALGIACFPFDPQQNNQYGNMTIYNTSCNIQSQIDFTFGTDTVLTCDGSSCSVSNPKNSTMKFLDVNGVDLQLTLSSAELTTSQLGKNVSTASYYFVFRFETSESANKVNVIVPIDSTVSSSYIIDIQKLNSTLQAPFTSLNDLSNMNSGIALSTFNILNLRDYSKFYHVSNPQKTETFLISIMNFKTKNSITNSIPTSSIQGTVLNYAQTGNKLCYTSLETSGLFQTHLRESWPLWTAWIALLFYWLYAMIFPQNTKECFDKRFQNNKLTCWSFYSVHFIGHQQFFTRLSRTTLMLINFSIQGVILAAIFLTLGPSQGPQMIIWAAFIALFATQPVPFLLGGLFLHKIHKLTLDKFKIMKKSKSTAVKQNNQDSTYETQIDKLQQKLFTLNYWFYVIAFVLFTSLWTVSVHLLKELPRIYYTQHHYWISSLACCFVMQHLIFQPILAAIFGNFSFYRIRGYFYDYALGQQFKQIDE